MGARSSACLPSAPKAIVPLRGPTAQGSVATARQTVPTNAAAGTSEVATMAGPVERVMVGGGRSPAETATATAAGSAQSRVPRIVTGANAGIGLVGLRVERTDRAIPPVGVGAASRAREAATRVIRQDPVRTADADPPRATVDLPAVAPARAAAAGTSSGAARATAQGAEPPPGVCG